MGSRACEDLAMPMRRWLPPYLLTFVAVALLLSLSELQGYVKRGGTRPWEPFLWEFSSVVCVGLLTLALYRLTRHLRGRPWLQQVLGHLFGYSAYVLLHVAGMFGIRFAVYAAAGVGYEPGPWIRVLAYEAGKDGVSYLTLVLLIHGFLAWRAEQAKAEELERTRRELAEAQAARLADQVQPHFLFNTLNLIAQTMHEDVSRADALLCELAGLLRQTSQAQQRGEHTLAEELNLVRPFLALMQARFGERLQVVLDVDEAAAQIRLPSLLLLAPVENAIKHDVATHRGAVCVRLRARVEAGRLRIDVHNSGVVEAGPSGGGLGLTNVRERLQARYGAAARVALAPSEGGMRLQLELPT